MPVTRENPAKNYYATVLTELMVSLLAWKGLYIIGHGEHEDERDGSQREREDEPF